MIWLKVSGISGVIAPILAFTLILVAIVYSPSFSWTENAPSDLGVQGGVTAVLFNAGLIISGVLAVLFATVLFTLLKGNLLGRIGAFVLVLDAFALTAIGVFPENVKPAHFYASVIFFVLFPISMLFLSAAFLRTSNTKLGFFTLIVAVVAAVVWVFHSAKVLPFPRLFLGFQHQRGP